VLDRSKIGFEFPKGTATIERGRVKRYAQAIGAADPVYSNVDAARARGFTDIPIPPTFLYTLELDREPAADFLQTVGAEMGNLLHGEQTLRFHRHLCAGEQIQFQTRIEDIFTKGPRDLEFLILHTRVLDSNSVVVAELRATFIVPFAERQ
jgi:hypothetical protein